MTDFAQKWTYKKFLKLISPTIFSMLFIALFTIVDAIFVSRKLGATALGSLNISLPAINLIFGVAFMISIGSSAIIGINLGEEKKAIANKKFSLTIYLLIIFSLLNLIIGLTFSHKIAHILGASETMFPYTSKYLSVILTFSFAFIFKVFSDVFLRVEGQFNLFMLGTVLGGITNIILDYLFIYILDMGIVGAAYGTVIGAALNGAIGIIYFLKPNCKLKLVKPNWDFNFIKQSFGNGSSELVSSVASGITTFLFNITLLKLVGDIGVSSISILLYLNFFLSSFNLGICMGIQPAISFNYGAKKIDNIKYLLKMSLITIGISTIITFILCQIYNVNLVKFFTSDNNALITMTSDALKIFSISFLFNGFNILASSVFTALNNGTISALISFNRSLIFMVICIILLPKIFGITGIWIAVPISEVLTVFLSIFFFLKTKKVMDMDGL